MVPVGNTDLKNATLVFEYPLRHRLPMLLISVFILLIELLILAGVLVSLIRLITGQTLLSSTGTDEPGTLIAATVFLVFMSLGMILVHLMFPAIHIRNSGFRISRLFYTSPWLNWSDIDGIRTHWLSRKRRQMIGIKIRGIAPIYGLIGAVQLLGSKGFLVYDGIHDFAGLMELLRRQRPDLFK